jgi:hypothetical protein
MRNDRRDLGSSVVVPRIEKRWVYGALVNSPWSVSPARSEQSYNPFLLQPSIRKKQCCNWGIYLFVDISLSARTR